MFYNSPHSTKTMYSEIYNNLKYQAYAKDQTRSGVPNMYLLQHLCEIEDPKTPKNIDCSRLIYQTDPMNRATTLVPADKKGEGVYYH